MIYKKIDNINLKNFIINNNFKKPKINFKKKIAIYGAGDMCKMALNFFYLNSINPEYIFDNKVKNINGKKVLNLNHLSNIDKNINICVCLSDNNFFSVFKFLKKKGFKNIFHFYEYSEKLKNIFYLTNGWFFRSKKIDEYVRYSRYFFKDSLSKKFYDNFFLWHTTRQVFKHIKIKKNIYFNKLTHTFLKKKKNIYLDIGTGYGKSLSTYLKKYSPRKVICIDGCQTVTNYLKKKYIKNKKIKIFNHVLSNKIKQANFHDNLYHISKISKFGKKIKTKKLDDLNIHPNIIKLHAEGEELNILKGAIKTLKVNTPLLFINIYHNSDGLFKIFKYMSRFSGKYNFFLRGYSFVGTNYILYCVPKKKII